MVAAASRQRRACYGLVAAAMLTVVALMMSASRQGPLSSSPASRANSLADLMTFSKRMLRVEASPAKRAAEGWGAHRRERMAAYLAERAKCDDPSHPESRWRSVDAPAEDIALTYTWTRDRRKGADPRPLGMQTCEVEDAAGASGWTFTRFGPLLGEGGYDWHFVSINPMPRSRKAKFITAKMFAPVTRAGAILGYPPVHAHHVHMILDSIRHWFDSHGDSICTEEQGGTACYLREEPEGYGLPLRESETYELEFALNDVREQGSPAMPFYMEASLRWSADESLTAVSRAHFERHQAQHPFSTILLPLREESVTWQSSEWLVPGQVIYSPENQYPFFHSHRSFLKGMWAFAARPEELGLTMDLLERTPQELAGAGLEVANENDVCWIPRQGGDGGHGGGGAKRALMDRIARSEAGLDALRCWLEPDASKPDARILDHVSATNSSSSLYPEAWQQNWVDSWYDRVGQVHCNGTWDFDRGGSYTIVALNGLDPRLDDGSWDTPNLQHAGFKLVYETFEEVPGPNWEVFGSFEGGLGLFGDAEDGLLRHPSYNMPSSFPELAKYNIQKSDKKRLAASD